MKRIALIAAMLLVGFAASIVNGEEKPTIFVSILPQKFFVQQISGNLLNVEVMVMPGASPATYEPRPSQMKMLSDTSVYFSIGVPFENAWLEKIAEVNPDMAVVKTDAGIKKRKMAVHHHHDEDGDGHHEEEHHKDEGHGHGEAHHDEDEHHDTVNEEEGLDPHVWLSPVLVKQQLGIIKDQLVTLLPEHEADIAAGYQQFVEKIDVLDAELKSVLAGLEGGQFMVFHPSWGYLADEYGLVQIPAEIEGKDPKPAQLTELIKHAKEQNIKVVFAQPQFSKKSAGVIAREIGGEVIFINPLEENWLDNLLEVAKTFKETVK